MDAGDLKVPILRPDRNFCLLPQQVQRQGDDRPVIFVSTSHPCSSFVFIALILVGFDPIDRQRNQNRQQDAQIKVAFARDRRKMLQHFISNCGQADDARCCIVDQNGTRTANDRRREHDVRVSDENVGQP